MAPKAGAPAASQPAASRKRKKPPHPDLAHRKKRRVEAQDARVIAAQTKGKAFGDGEIDVDKFVRAREFEIKALEHAIQRSKKSLASRAFQNVPKDLRRRTASHNAKRVPKRLRARASREMKEDNTPTVTAKNRKNTSHVRLRLDTVKRLKTLSKRPKSDARTKQAAAGASVQGDNSKSNAQCRDQSIRTKAPRVKKNRLSKPAIPNAKFRKRQVHKSWLPTHVFHAKRAHMTPPTEPLWRMAIPLSPTMKSYRPTHRASSIRGSVAWDTSYMSTLSLEGAESSLLEILSGLGYGQEEAKLSYSGRKEQWLNGSRSWEGWLREPGSMSTNSIAPAQIVWIADGCKPESSDCAAAESMARKPILLKRKVFIRTHPSAFLQLWESIISLAKAQKPKVAIEDLRFEIGSIELVGPASAEALVGVLRPPSHLSNASSKAQDVTFWPRLSGVTDPANLPPNAVVNMEVSDPRLRQHLRTEDSLGGELQQRQDLLSILSNWPPDKQQRPSTLFDRACRMKACRQLPSQKAINRRKTLAGPGAAPEPLASDPRIPVTVLVTKSNGASKGSWTLLLPWKCVPPVWQSLMYYPLSGGRTVSFGGLDQKRQVAFETETPWFPGDFPSTKAGMAWETREREKRKADWEKRPKSKRVAWESVPLGEDRKGEVGLGWACDWEKLIQIGDAEENHGLRLLRVPTAIAIAVSKTCLGSSVALTSHHSRGLVTVKIEALGRGVPSICARVYRLPTTDAALREQWVSMVETRRTGVDSKARPLGFAETKGAPEHVRSQHLAASLLEPEGASTRTDKGHPTVPEDQDLIGFVTSGNFSLGEGRGIGIGSILLDKVLAQSLEVQDDAQQRKERHLCIVRDAGHSVGRLARWHFVG